MPDSQEQRFFKHKIEGLQVLLQRQIEVEKKFFDVERFKIDNFVELFWDTAIKRYGITDNDNLKPESLYAMRLEVLGFDSRHEELISKQKLSTDEKEELARLENYAKSLGSLDWMSARQIISSFLKLKSSERGQKIEKSKTDEIFVIAGGSLINIANSGRMKDWIRQLGKYNEILDSLYEITGKNNPAAEKELAKLMLDYARLGKAITADDLKEKGLGTNGLIYSIMRRVVKPGVNPQDAARDCLAQQLNSICFLVFILEIFRRKYNKTAITDLPFAIAQARAMKLLIADQQMRMAYIFGPDSNFGIATGENLSNKKDDLIKKLNRINLRYFKIYQPSDEAAQDFLAQNPDGIVIPTKEELHQELLGVYTPKNCAEMLESFKKNKRIPETQFDTLKTPDTDGESYSENTSKRKLTSSSAVMIDKMKKAKSSQTMKNNNNNNNNTASDFDASDEEFELAPATQEAVVQPIKKPLNSNSLSSTSASSSKNTEPSEDYVEDDDIEESQGYFL